MPSDTLFWGANYFAGSTPFLLQGQQWEHASLSLEQLPQHDFGAEPQEARPKIVPAVRRMRSFFM